MPDASGQVPALQDAIRSMKISAAWIQQSVGEGTDKPLIDPSATVGGAGGVGPRGSP